MTAEWKMLEWNTGDSEATFGFLQMCIERRFHRVLQSEFERTTGIGHSRYFVESDVGGAPMMEDQNRAAEYCYQKKNARIMGWCAHGATCGGFGDGVSDETIRAELDRVFEMRVIQFPDAEHHAFFATVHSELEREHVVVWHKGPVDSSTSKSVKT